MSDAVIKPVVAPVLDHDLANAAIGPASGAKAPSSPGGKVLLPDPDADAVELFNTLMGQTASPPAETEADPAPAGEPASVK
jgi:hypothetical protein